MEKDEENELMKRPKWINYNKIVKKRKSNNLCFLDFALFWFQKFLIRFKYVLATSTSIVATATTND